MYVEEKGEKGPTTSSKESFNNHVGEGHTSKDGDECDVRLRRGVHVRER
jgi:hypothetical protein